MKTEKIKRKLKGSVLLTVVSVMGLLIIFLSGTLVLATAANRRAHRSYSTSQAELTAKAAIESFTTAMANNEQIAAAVKNLDKTYHPTVSINDPSLGHIGYYDASGNYIENAITIEPLSTSGKYVHGKFDLNNPSAEVWQEATQVKITVTARVGKEEKTVSALLNKVGLSNNVPSDDIGLYAGGDASFDGGGGTANYIYSPLAVGLTTNGGGVTKIKNGSQIYSPLVFLNENALINNQSCIHVVQPKQSMVVRGNMYVDNNLYVNIDYSMTNNYTQKDIPYMFIEGDLSYLPNADFSALAGPHPPSGGHIYIGKATYDNGKVNGVTLNDVSPYNLFAGSIGSINPFQSIEMAGDIYLMDAGKTSTIGSSGAQNNLYNWASSVFNKTNNQNYSSGGNIYSKGNVVFNSKMHLTGDVRVEGNVTFNADVDIDGDLVVGGTITGKEHCKMKPGKMIYNDTLTGGATLKAGYRKLYGTYIPAGIGSQYKKVENIKVSNYAYPNIAVFESNVEEWSLSPSGYKYQRTSPNGVSHDINESEVNNHLDGEGNAPTYVKGKRGDEWQYVYPDEELPGWWNAANADDYDEWTLDYAPYYDQNHKIYTSPDGSQSIDLGANGGQTPDKILVDTTTNTRVTNYDASEGLKYYPVDKDGNEIAGAATVDYAESFFRADVDGNVTDERIPDDLDPMYKTWTYYLADVNGNAVLDGSGNGTIIDPASTPVEDLEYTYYDTLAPGGPAQIAFASIPPSTGYYEFSIPDPVDPTKNYIPVPPVASIYVDASNNIVTEAEAMNSGDNIEKIAAWTGKSGDTIYPAKMEKDVIYGSVVGGIFQKSTDTNQFILTLDDMQSKISYRKIPGTEDMEFDSVKYPTTEPANVDKDYTDSTVQSNGVIEKSCVISGYQENKNIVICPKNEIWVILDGVTLDKSKIVVDSNAGGDCKFFIKGDLTLLTSSSIYSTLCMKNGDTIRYNNSLHIYYYGEEGSSINVSAGNSLITGYGRCPKTSLVMDLGTGPFKDEHGDPGFIDYIDERGKHNYINPAWIGNVIYDGSHSSNNLTFALVKEGGGGNVGTIKTGVGYFEYEYFSSN